MAEISFTSPTISYTSELSASYEADAMCSVSPYTYESVSATDSHNGAVDVCERVWHDEAGLHLCCTPPEREAMTDGWSDETAYGWPMALRGQETGATSHV